MSVLNQSGEEQVECPLCMEALEVDDLNFFPCTCGYQICRFCWHRIRTDENGLCPACRKAYSENPADFTPLSKEQVAQLKAEKRQKDQQRKAKLSENRKHLASVRVVQRNLVFVVGLPLRLADAEVLKKHEYFGKFGKIHKVVINQSTSYAGSQGPSASAYVTYMKSDDALRAIQSVNNIFIDGRQVKSSLGTTKYCSHFMKNQPCPKPDCMYLHDFGDSEASFTKEQMHAGKHQEYEKKLHDALNLRTQQQQAQISQSQPQSQAITEPAGAKQTTQTTAKSKENVSNGAARDSWPQLNDKLDKNEKKLDVKQLEKEKPKGKSKAKNGTDVQKRPDKKEMVQATKETTNMITNGKSSEIKLMSAQNSNEILTQNTAKSKDASSSDSELSSLAQSVDSISSCGSSRSALPMLDDNSSFFSSQNSFQKIVPEAQPNLQTEEEVAHENGDLNAFADALPDISSSEDWEAAFGFAKPALRNPGQVQIAGNAPPTSVKDSLDSFGSNFGCGLGNGNPQINNRLLDQGYNNGKLDMFGSRLDNNSAFSSHKGYDVNESLIEALSKNSTPYGHQLYKSPSNTLLDERLIPYSVPQQNHMKEMSSNNGMNGLNGVDHNMSKFFSDIYKNGQKEMMYGGQMGMGLSSQQNGLSGQQTGLNGLTNGMNGLSHHHNAVGPQNMSGGSFLSLEDKHALLAMQHQRQITEQLMNLNLQHKQQQQQQQQHGYGMTNGLHSGLLLANGSAPVQNQQYSGQSLFGNNMLPTQPTSKVSGVRNPEEELDFDPILETQKAFAEIIQNEQHNNMGLHNSSNQSTLGSNQVNGMIHNQNSNNSHCPPPPGFVQPNNSHHNSFAGSKILPFLNINQQQQQQQITNNSQQNNWSSNFGHVPQQPQPQQQHKPIGVCNDWKLIDPAILRSTKQVAFPLSNMPLRDQFNPLQLGMGMQTGAQQSPFDAFNAFSSFGQQSNFGFLNNSQQQNPQASQLSNWLGADLGAQQISSPPGFRTSQPSQGKQQEC